ncbi:MAG: hypothetical protein AAFU03_11090 [Bacteroidota bacterium]
MNRFSIFSFCALFVVFLSTCQWDLDEEIFPTFLEAIQVGNLQTTITKRGFWERPTDGQIFLGGSDLLGRMAVYEFNQDGVSQGNYIIDHPGTIHTILAGVEEGSIICLGSDSISSHLFSLDLGTSVNSPINNGILDAANSNVGFISTVQLTTVAQKENGYLAAGSIQQRLGPPGLAFADFSADLGVVEVNYFLTSFLGCNSAVYNGTDLVVSGPRPSGGETFFMRYNREGSQIMRRSVLTAVRSTGDFYLDEDAGEIYFAISQDIDGEFVEEIRAIQLDSNQSRIVLVSEEREAFPADIAVGPFVDVDGENTMLLAASYGNEYVITNRSFNENTFRWQRRINHSSEESFPIYVGESFDGGVLAAFLEHDLVDSTAQVRFFKFDAVGDNDD